MGANISNQLNSSINEAIVDQSTKVLGSVAQYSTSVLEASQNQEFNFDGATFKNCDLTFIQNMTITSKVYSTLDATAQADLTSLIDKTLKNDLTAKVDQTMKDLALAESNVSKIKNYMNNYNYTDMSKQISQTLISNFNSSVVASQNQKFSFKGVTIDCSETGNVLFSQNINIDNTVTNSVKSLQNNKTLSDYKEDISNIALADTKQFIDGINPADILIAFAVIIVVCALIFFIWKGTIPNPFTKLKQLFSKKKKTAFGRRKFSGKSARKF